MSLRVSYRASHITRSYATKSRPTPRKPPPKTKSISKPPPPPPRPFEYNESQTLSLPDSRTLGFSTYGPSNGPALLVFHGFPGSRRDAGGMVDEDLGIRVIGIDRPGMGLSTFQKNRRLTDWPADVMQLTRHLGVKSFRVIGGSGGGPYALACANAIPKDVLKATGIVSGFGPIEAGLATMSKREYRLWRTLPYAPGLLKLRTWWSIGRKINNPNPVVRAKAIRAIAGEMGHDGELSEDNINGITEPFRQGVNGYVEDALVLFKPWGFKLEDVKARNVHLWYGENDANTPVEMGRYMADRLEGGVIHTFAGETHFTLMSNHGDNIIKDLMKAGI